MSVGKCLTEITLFYNLHMLIINYKYIVTRATKLHNNPHNLTL